MIEGRSNVRAEEERVERESCIEGNSEFVICRLMIDMHKAEAGKMSAVIGVAKVLVKITQTFRTGEFGVNVRVDAKSRLREIDGSGIFFSSSRRPISRPINSVLNGFSI